MFDIGFPELILIAIVGLLVIGPDRLPEALRTLGLWLGRMRRSFTAVKAEIEKEIGMDEVKRQLHNEAIMEDMKRIEQEVQSATDAARQNLNKGIQAAEASAAAAAAGVAYASEAAAVAEAASQPPAGGAAEQIPSIDPQVQMDIADVIARQDQMSPDSPEESKTPERSKDEQANSG
jgi:sec-independent protein translocase protein TatB